MFVNRVETAPLDNNCSRPYLVTYLACSSTPTEVGPVLDCGPETTIIISLVTLC